MRNRSLSCRHKQIPCSMQASLEQRVAAMRFYLACLSAWQYQSPLTEPDFIAELQEWATTEIAKGPLR